MPEISSIDQDIFCQDCGYNLRSLTGERCPECGRSLEGLRSAVSRIPWVHRKEIGRFRAYWKTVFFVMFRQQQFCDELIRPVSYVDSQKFRWVTVALAFLPLLTTSIIIWNTRSPFDSPIVDPVWDSSLLSIGTLLAVLGFLAVMTGIPSYFCCFKSIPIHLQNRAIALSYYASAPLVFLAIPCAAILIHEYADTDQFAIVAVLIAILTPLLVSTLWLTQFDFLYARLFPGRRGTSILLTLLMPIIGLVVLGVILLFILLLILSVYVIFSSVL